MANSTVLGPVGINQLNTVFYVGGDGGFPNVQAAIDYIVKYNGGVGHVTILHGYTGEDPLGSLVNGNDNIYITDLRYTLSQNWEWTDALGQFTTSPFHQYSHGVFGGRLTAYGFHVPDFTASNASIGVGLDGPGWRLVNTAAPVNQGLWGFFAYTDRLIFSSPMDSGVDNYWLWANRSGNTVTKVVIVPNVDVQGILTSQGSPVRTFANSGDGGGGGGGGVNPGTQGQLSFYGVDGPLISPTAITTDVATQSTLNVPAMITSGQSTTDVNTFANRSAANWGYVQEQTISVIGGGGSNSTGNWSVSANGSDTMYHAQRGIAQIRGGFIERHAIGDTAGLYFYVKTDGGEAAGADEGVTGISVHVLENLDYFGGTVNTTTGYGDQAPSYNHTSGPNHTIDGAFMLNISKGQLAGNWNGPSVETYMDTGAGATITFLNQLPITNVAVTAAAWNSSIIYAAGNIVSSGGTNYVSLSLGNRANSPASSPTKWAVLPAGQVPISTAIGIATAAIPFNNVAANAPVSVTITVNLVKIGTGFPLFAVNDVVTVAGNELPEQSIILAATTAGTQQTLTLKLRNENAQAILFKGGLQGQYISHDANLVYSGMRSSYYALGSQTGTEVIYAHNVVGSVVGRLLPMRGSEAATSSGANSGVHFFPGAEIVCNPTFGFDGTLEQNGVRWEPGDAVENPHYPAGGGNGIMLNKFQQTPTPPAGGSAGLALLLDGPGFVGSSCQAVLIRSNVASTRFAADGGPVDAPGGISVIGYYAYGLALANAPTGYMLQVSNPAAPVNNPYALVNVISIGYSGGGNLQYDPTPAKQTWTFSGNLVAGSIIAQGNLNVGGGATFFPGGVAGGVAITGSNAFFALNFHEDDGSGSGVPQRIAGYFGGFPQNFNIYLDTINDGAIAFRVASYGGQPAQVMSVDGSGLHVVSDINTATQLNAPIINVVSTTNTTASIYLKNTNTAGVSVAGLHMSSDTTDVFELVVWGTGNGAGLDGCMGFYDATRGGFIWNTNPAGDMFFSTPISGGNVGAGAGAPARITAAGLIDGTAFSVGGVAGASGTITASSTVTVVNGLITSIV
jgi:hypothetical protein